MPNVIRLGAYTAKAPVYNSLKACKGTMFFLPLPFEKTLQTLEDIENDDTYLPAPELYVILRYFQMSLKIFFFLQLI